MLCCGLSESKDGQKSLYDCTTPSGSYVGVSSNHADNIDSHTQLSDAIGVAPLAEARQQQQDPERQPENSNDERADTQPAKL